MPDMMDMLWAIVARHDQQLQDIRYASMSEELKPKPAGVPASAPKYDESGEIARLKHTAEQHRAMIRVYQQQANKHDQAYAELVRFRNGILTHLFPRMDLKKAVTKHTLHTTIMKINRMAGNTKRSS